jgi:hypothetical protein
MPQSQICGDVSELYYGRTDRSLSLLVGTGVSVLKASCCDGVTCHAYCLS